MVDLTKVEWTGLSEKLKSCSFGEETHIHEFYLQEPHQILREKLKKIPFMALEGKRGLEIIGKCPQSVFQNKSSVSRGKKDFNRALFRIT